MGLTIHYEGRLKDLNALDQVLTKAQAFAEDQQWPFEQIDEAHKRLRRFTNDDPNTDEDSEEIIYEGPVQGLTLYPHPECEPFTLEFDSELFCQDYTKTQFAGPDIHIKLIELLSDLQPLFITLSVVDESDYWDERDEIAVRENFRCADKAINDALREYPYGRYKVRTPDGRMIDIIT